MSTIEVCIDDVGSILNSRIGFCLWLSALAGQNFSLVLEASRWSILNFRIGFGGRLLRPCLLPLFLILRHSFAWKTPTPTDNIRTQKVKLCALYLADEWFPVKNVSRNSRPSMSCALPLKRILRLSAVWLKQFQDFPNKNQEDFRSILNIFRHFIRPLFVSFRNPPKFPLLLKHLRLCHYFSSAFGTVWTSSIFSSIFHCTFEPIAVAQSDLCNTIPGTLDLACRATTCHLSTCNQVYDRSEYAISDKFNSKTERGHN